MGGLQSVSHLNDGTRVAAEEGLRDIVRALKFGDGIRGWEGDENMEVFVDLSDGTFDVWSLDERNHPYIVLSRPYCDHRLIDDILAADSRRRDVAAAAKATNERLDEQRRQDFHDHVEEVSEKLQHALLKDHGHRVFHPFPDGVPAADSREE